MLKIKDLTTKRSRLNMLDCKLWNNEVIIFIINMYNFEKEIIINNEIVNQYNWRTDQNKSDASFVRQVKKLNKQGYFKLLEKVEEVSK